ncbi:MAG: hypothetical protein ACM3IJ_04505 [Candidatus Levyibacteriota bacterium]
MNILKQSLVIILATAIVFAIVNTPAISVIPYILGFIVGVSLVYAFFRKRVKKQQETFIGSNKEIFTIIVFVLLVVFLTGGISSVLFFLTYFLIFGITFVFEPTMILLFLVGLSVLFIPGALQDEVFSNIIKLSSIFLLTPIAFFFAREYKKRERLENKVNQTTKIIITDAKELLNTQDKKERVEKASEIIQEAESLKEETQ